MKIKNTIKKIPWSLVSVVLALFFGFFAVYSVFHIRQPNVLFEITNEIDVLDVRKPLENLSISFMGEDIEKRNLNLRIFTVRIENNGEIEILQNRYDTDDVWGIQVNQARIIEVRFMDSNSDYLKSKINPSIIDENKIEFNKVILEKGKYFTVEILVLHMKKEYPEIISIGKIAGIEKIIPIKSWLEKEKKTFWENVFQGNVLYHFLRAFIYLLIIVLVGIAIALGFSGFNSIKKKVLVKKRKKEMIETFGEEILESGVKKNLPFRYYADYGYSRIEDLNTMLSDKKGLSKYIKLLQSHRGEIEIPGHIITRRGDMVPGRDYPIYEFVMRDRLKLLNELIKEEVLKVKDKSEIIIDTDFEKSLVKLMKYLEEANK